MEEKKIFTRKLALRLRERGFAIIKTEPNRNKPQFDVYIFKDTDELELAIGDIMSQEN